MDAVMSDVNLETARAWLQRHPATQRQARMLYEYPDAAEIFAELIAAAVAEVRVERYGSTFLTDDTGTPASEPTPLVPQWRVGTKLGRTLYRDGVCVGMVDTPEIAAEIVTEMNASEPAPSGDTVPSGCGR